MLAADLNGDTRPDLITGGGGFSSGLAVFLNQALMDVNGASFVAGPLAPDSFATAVAPGAALATAAQTAAPPYPTNLGGTTVTVTDALGVARLAPLYYVSPGQVNYLIPSATGPGPAVVSVSVGSTAVTGGGVSIAAVGPGLFLFQGTNIVAAYAARPGLPGARVTARRRALQGVSTSRPRFSPTFRPASPRRPFRRRPCRSLTCPSTTSNRCTPAVSTMASPSVFSPRSWKCRFAEEVVRNRAFRSTRTVWKNSIAGCGPAASGI